MALAPACQHLFPQRSIYVVAQGSTDAIPNVEGPCDPASVHPDRIVAFEPSSSETFYTAVGPGLAWLRCRDGEVGLDVRVPARIWIDGPDRSPASGAFSAYRLRAADASGHELEIGHYSRVAWSKEGALELQGVCIGDIIPNCLGAQEIEARGSGRLLASFGGREAALGIDSGSR